jgi:5-methylcytosine-specific restriction endonuclease McrA
MDREPMKNDVPLLWRQRAKAGLCPVCGKTSDQFEPMMRVYCSSKCRDEYASKYTYWSVEREKFIRVHGKICDICGITLEKIKEYKEVEYRNRVKEWLSNPVNHKKLEDKRDEALVNLSEYFQNKYDEIMDDIVFFDSSLWEEQHKLREKLIDYTGFEVDHIKALCNGGDMWDTSNWRVLCSECHKKKTSQDLKDRKRIRNKTKILVCAGDD